MVLLCLASICLLLCPALRVFVHLTWLVAWLSYPAFHVVYGVNHHHQCVARNYCFRLRHAHALAGFCICTASGISPILRLMGLRSRRRSWHGASSMPLAFFSEKLLLIEPANAGSTRAHSAMFENADFSDLTAF
jgi:hypothetical protein